MSYYLMHRGWMENDLFRGEPYNMRSAWVWLIENAAWEPATVSIDRKPIRLERGELSFSERFLAQRWKWSRSRVHRFLSDLTTWGMISVRNSPVQKSDHQRDRPQNILTVCNYCKYQDIGTILAQKAEPSLNHLRTISEPKKKEVNTGKQDSDSPDGESAPADPIKELFDRGVRLLTDCGAKEPQARSIIGKWRKTYSDPLVMAAIVHCEDESISDPVPQITRFLANHRGANGHGKPRSSEDRMRAGLQAIIDADREEDLLSRGGFDSGYDP